MPVSFVPRSRFVEHDGQFKPAWLPARFDLNDTDFAGYLDISALRPSARQSNLYLDEQATISVALLAFVGNLVLEAILETKAETTLHFVLSGAIQGSLPSRLITPAEL